MYALTKCTDPSNELIIKWLLQHGANPNLCKVFGTDCPIETAIDCGKLYAVKLLIEYGCQYDKNKILEKISRSDRFKSVFGYNEKNKIYELISKDYTPVDLLIIKKFFNSNKEEMNKMLTQGSANDRAITDIDVINENGTTALMYQAQYGNIDTMEYLLHNKANPNIKDNKDNNALFYAINAEKDNIKKIELLLSNGIKLEYDKLIEYIRTKYSDTNNQLFNDIQTLLDEYKNSISIGGNFSKNNKIKDDIYKNKYLKYKNKYLDLKKSI
jgi:ankyrin repeat protein